MQAYDGRAWSEWKSFTVQPPANRAPIVAGVSRNATLGATPLAALSLVTATEPDGDPVVKYQFWDSGSAPSSGYFTLNGVRQGADVAVEVMANQLAQAAFVPGSTPGSEPLWVRASDGTAWSAWQPFSLTTLASS